MNSTISFRRAVTCRRQIGRRPSTFSKEAERAADFAIAFVRAFSRKRVEEGEG